MHLRHSRNIFEKGYNKFKGQMHYSIKNGERRKKREGAKVARNWEKRMNPQQFFFSNICHKRFFIFLLFLINKNKIKMLDSKNYVRICFVTFVHLCFFFLY